jgi:hypothetical protein
MGFTVSADGLLGKRVRITLSKDDEQPHVIVTGILLSWSEMGECAIEHDNGDLVHCWPMLDIEEAA